MPLTVILIGGYVLSTTTLATRRDTLAVVGTLLLPIADEAHGGPTTARDAQ